MGEEFLDVRGYQCPAPLIKLSKIIKNKLKQGDIVRMAADDPACRDDVEAWCEKTGNKLLECKQENNIQYFLIKKESP